MENGERLRSISTQCGCLICGERDLVVLQWHHVNPSLKKFNILSSMALSWDRLWAECEKCVILCANDHRRVEKGVIELPGGYPDDDEQAFSFYTAWRDRNPLPDPDDDGWDGVNDPNDPTADVSTPFLGSLLRRSGGGDSKPEWGTGPDDRAGGA